MFNQQLLDYIKQQQSQGVAKEVINNNLLLQGWQQQDINEVFSIVESQSVRVQSNAPKILTGDANKNKWAVIGLILGLMGLFVFPFVYSYLLDFFFPHSSYLSSPVSSSKSIFTIAGIFLQLFVSISGVILSIKGLKSSRRIIAIIGIILNLIVTLRYLPMLFGSLAFSLGLFFGV